MCVTQYEMKLLVYEYEILWASSNWKAHEIQAPPYTVYMLPGYIDTQLQIPYIKHAIDANKRDMQTMQITQPDVTRH